MPTTDTQSEAAFILTTGGACNTITVKPTIVIASRVRLQSGGPTLTATAIAPATGILTAKGFNTHGQCELVEISAPIECFVLCGSQ